MNTGVINLSITFLGIRFLQAWRFLKELGVIRAFILLIFCLHIVFLLSRLYFGGTFIAGIAAVITILSVHAARKDRKFLAFTFGRQGYRVMIFEYFVLSLPCSIYYIVSGNLWSLAILLAAVISVPFIAIKFKRKGYSGSISNLFPARAFELRSCFRENSVILFLLLLLGGIFSKYMAVPVFSMAAVSLIFAFSTTYNEPGIMLETFSSAGQLLRYKLLSHFKVLVIFLTPLALAFLWFHFDYWYVLACLLAICCIVSALSVLLKYAFYIPDRDVLANRVLIGVSIVCFLIVYLAPVPLIMLIFFYYKANNNLKKYFYAQH